MAKTQQTQQTQATPATSVKEMTYNVKGLDGQLSITVPDLFKFGKEVYSVSKVSLEGLTFPGKMSNELNFKHIAQSEAIVGDMQYLPELDLTITFVGDGIRNNAIWVKKDDNWLLCSGNGQTFQKLLILLGISPSKALYYYDWLVWTRNSSPRNPDKPTRQGSLSVKVDNIKDLLGL